MYFVINHKYIKTLINCPFIAKNGSIIGDYNCILWDKNKLTLGEYAKPIEVSHSNEEGACAIWSIQSWVNKNYKTNRLGYVDLSHKKELNAKRRENFVLFPNFF